MFEFNPCIVVPVYNHERAIGTVLAGLLRAGVPCLLVDDGSLFVVQPEHGASLITALARLGGESVAILANDPSVGAGAIDALFVVERQPRHGFLTWFGVFARCRGRVDRLLLETPDGPVARFVERAIEDRLGLADEPVRGELRLA